MSEFKYDVAISFAGEDRKYAEEIAESLRKNHVKVFYDLYEQSSLWGKDLYEYLADVYSKHARYCIMLLSQSYANKLWTNHERQNAQERAFREREEYILPVRIDDTQIPGIRETIGYIDLRMITISDLTELVVSKLGKNTSSPSVPEDFSSRAQFEIHVPKIKKKFSQLDKDRFVKAAFSLIREYFGQGLQKVKSVSQEVEVDFTDVSQLKFVAKIYSNGRVISQCKIWMGSTFPQDSICYSENFYDVHNDSSMNDWMTVGSDGFSLFLTPSGMGYSFDSSKKNALTELEAADYFWRRFTGPLST